MKQQLNRRKLWRLMAAQILQLNDLLGQENYDNLAPFMLLTTSGGRQGVDGMEEQ